MAGSSDTLVSARASIVIDDAHWPLVIGTWFGEPDLDIVEQYFRSQPAMLDRARRGKVRLLMVSDTTELERSSPVVRQRIADLSKALPADAAALTMRNYVVLSNPLIRGVVTALSWVMPMMREIESVPTLREALERGVALLRAEGLDAPGLVPSEKRRPARPKHS